MSNSTSTPSVGGMSNAVLTSLVVIPIVLVSCIFIVLVVLIIVYRRHRQRQKEKQHLQLEVQQMGLDSNVVVVEENPPSHSSQQPPSPRGIARVDRRGRSGEEVFRSSGYDQRPLTTEENASAGQPNQNPNLRKNQQQQQKKKRPVVQRRKRRGLHIPAFYRRKKNRKPKKKKQQQQQQQRRRVRQQQQQTVVYEPEDIVIVPTSTRNGLRAWEPLPKNEDPAASAASAVVTAHRPPPQQQQQQQPQQQRRFPIRIPKESRPQMMSHRKKKTIEVVEVIEDSSHNEDVEATTEALQKGNFLVCCVSDQRRSAGLVFYEVSDSDSGGVLINHQQENLLTHDLDGACYVGESKLAVHGSSPFVYLYDFVAKRITAKFEGHSDHANCLHFLVGARGQQEERRALLASGSYDRDIRLWRVDQLLKNEQVEEDEEPISSAAILHGHSEFVTSLTSCCRVYSNRLLSGSADGTIRLWDLPKETIHAPRIINTAFPPGSRSPIIYGLAIDPINGSFCVSGSSAQVIQLWDFRVPSWGEQIAEVIVGERVYDVKCPVVSGNCCCILASGDSSVFRYDARNLGGGAVYVHKAERAAYKDIFSIALIEKSGDGDESCARFATCSCGMGAEKGVCVERSIDDGRVLKEHVLPSHGFSVCFVPRIIRFGDE